MQIKAGDVNTSNSSGSTSGSPIDFVFYSLPESEKSKFERIKLQPIPEPIVGILSNNQRAIIISNTQYYIQKERMEKVKEEANRREKLLEQQKSSVLDVQKSSENDVVTETETIVVD